MELLTSMPWDNIGPGALLAFVIVLIVSGKLHTDREFQIILQDRDMWRDSALTLIGATKANTEAATVAAKMLESLPNANVDDG